MLQILKHSTLLDYLARPAWFIHRLLFLNAPILVLSLLLSVIYVMSWFADSYGEKRNMCTKDLTVLPVPWNDLKE